MLEKLSTNIINILIFKKILKKNSTLTDKDLFEILFF